MASHALMTGELDIPQYLELFEANTNIEGSFLL